MAMSRTIHTDLIKDKLVDLIRETSFIAPPFIKECFARIRENESTDIARETMNILIENTEIAAAEQIPLCQDTGVAVVFIELGQSVRLEGDYIYDAVNSAVEEAYRKFYLRKSVVSDPLERKNTGTNTPAFIHLDIVPGETFRLDLMLKGGGSENMSALRMFRPTDSVDMIIDYIEDTVVKAGPNPCPPLFLGVGIGGTADTAMTNSKRALLRPAGTWHSNPFYSDLEKRIYERLNSSGVGPMGFGGAGTAGAVCIKEAPAHIASLPVALNLNCHSLRVAGCEL